MVENLCLRKDLIENFYGFEILRACEPTDMSLNSEMSPPLPCLIAQLFVPLLYRGVPPNPMHPWDSPCRHGRAGLASGTTCGIKDSCQSYYSNKPPI